MAAARVFGFTADGLITDRGALADRAAMGAELRSVLSAWGAEVASALGAGWSVAPPKGGPAGSDDAADMPRQFEARLVHEGGLGVYLYRALSGKDAEQWTVSFFLQGALVDTGKAWSLPPEIRLSRKKTPVQVAREILARGGSRALVEAEEASAVYRTMQERDGKVRANVRRMMEKANGAGEGAISLLTEGHGGYGKQLASREGDLLASQTLYSGTYRQGVAYVREAEVFADAVSLALTLTPELAAKVLFLVRCEAEAATAAKDGKG